MSYTSSRPHHASSVVAKQEPATLVSAEPIKSTCVKPEHQLSEISSKPTDCLDSLSPRSQAGSSDSEKSCPSFANRSRNQKQNGLTTQKKLKNGDTTASSRLPHVVEPLKPFVLAVNPGTDRFQDRGPFQAVHRDVEALQQGLWGAVSTETLKDFDFISRLSTCPVPLTPSSGVPAAPSLPSHLLGPQGATLFVDLDETLSHTELFDIREPEAMQVLASLHRSRSDQNGFTSITTQGSGRPLPNLIFASPTLNDMNSFAFVYFRPWVRDFLSLLIPYYEIVCFTASLQSYADIILDVLDPQRCIKHRLYRTHCTQYASTGIYFKDLRQTGRPLSRSVILDNRLISFALNVDNGILVPSFTGDANDVALLLMLPYLASLSREPDIPKALLQKYQFSPSVRLYLQSDWKRSIDQMLWNPSFEGDPFESLKATWTPTAPNAAPQARSLPTSSSSSSSSTPPTKDTSAPDAKGKQKQDKGTNDAKEGLQETTLVPTALALSRDETSSSAECLEATQPNVPECLPLAAPVAAQMTLRQSKDVHYENGSISTDVKQTGNISDTSVVSLLSPYETTKPPRRRSVVQSPPALETLPQVATLHSTRQQSCCLPQHSTPSGTDGLQRDDNCRSSASAGTGGQGGRLITATVTPQPSLRSAFALQSQSAAQKTNEPCRPTCLSKALVESPMPLTITRATSHVLQGAEPLQKQQQQQQQLTSSSSSSPPPVQQQKQQRFPSLFTKQLTIPKRSASSEGIKYREHLSSASTGVRGSILERYSYTVSREVVPQPPLVRHGGMVFPNTVASQAVGNNVIHPLRGHSRKPSRVTSYTRVGALKTLTAAEPQVHEHCDALPTSSTTIALQSRVMHVAHETCLPGARGTGVGFLSAEPSPLRQYSLTRVVSKPPPVRQEGLSSSTATPGTPPATLNSSSWRPLRVTLRPQLSVDHRSRPQFPTSSLSS